MATREQIQQTVELLAEVATSMPIVRVPLPDLALWAQVLDVDEMDLALRYDSRVRATVTKYFPGADLLIVDTLADMARGLELPPCPDGNGFGVSVRLPVGDVWRLELLSAVTEGAA